LLFPFLLASTAAVFAFAAVAFDRAEETRGLAFDLGPTLGFDAGGGEEGGGAARDCRADRRVGVGGAMTSDSGLGEERDQRGIYAFIACR
jgi:hypothetical protein